MLKRILILNIEWWCLILGGAALAQMTREPMWFFVGAFLGLMVIASFVRGVADLWIRTAEAERMARRHPHYNRTGIGP